MAYSDLNQMFLSIQVLLIVLVDLCLGDVILMVSTYPARIYKGAPEGIPVLTVQGHDNYTGTSVTTFSLENSNDANFFKIDANGLITTKQEITFEVGRTFQFFVTGLINNQKDYRQVQIIVSAKNMHAPRFSLPSYSFIAYRYGTGSVIGHLEATDEDVETYNRAVIMFPDPDNMFREYIALGTDNQLRLIRPVPDQISTLSLIILATDEGSPQLTSTAEVVIQVVSVRQPDVFCMSSTVTTVTVCWKNPMTHMYFGGYNLTVTGSVNRSVLLPEIDGHTEACFTENGTGFGTHFVFKIVVRTTEMSYGAGINLVYNHTSVGVSKGCVSEGFSVCSYRNPCKENATCTTTSPTNYTCHCDFDWRGRNCESQDMCAYYPCKNDGNCEYKSHQQYKCHCLNGYYGDDCQHFNLCLDQPCLNSGTCVPLRNGTYRCDCPQHFTGDKCQTPDPCSPDPCLSNRGECLPLSDTSFTCECKKGYHGLRCELTDFCLTESQPCNYQGTCLPRNDSFICVCPFATTGERCEYLDACFVQPCLNSGTCTNGVIPGTYLCQCLPGYVGKECQNLDACLGVNCNNGTCHNDAVSQMRCQCFQGFYGEYCDKFDVCLTTPCNNQGTCSGSGPNLDYLINFSCQCLDSWSGLDCSLIDKCDFNMCKNGGTCKNLQGNNFTCICMEGYYLDDCSAFDPCSRHECQNGGVCHNVSQELYECECEEDWLGDQCEFQSPCSADRNPCQNDGQCHIFDFRSQTTVATLETSDPPSTDSYSPRCHCIEGYFGQNCQIIDPCLSSPCVQGECHFHGPSVDSVDVSTISGSETEYYVCSCHQNYTGNHCDLLINPCDNIACLNRGECVYGTCVCGPFFTGLFCEQEIPVCLENDSSDNGHTCADDEAMKNLQGLLDGTSNPSKLSAEQVLNFTDQLVSLYNHTLRDQKYAKTAFSILGNLAKVNVSISEQVEQTGNVYTRLREFLDNYTSEVRLEDNSGQINISASELHVKVISFQKIDLLSSDAIVFQPQVTDNDTSVELNVEIKIPSSILIDTTNETIDTRVQFIGYKRSQIFVPVDGLGDDAASLHGQPVISATIRGREARNLTVPVEIKLRNITSSRNYTCVFWDTEGSKWSTEGVTMVRYEPGSVTCASTHLTSFAILLNVNQDQSVSQEHEQILTYLTYIGCAISTSCLVFTIVTYAMFKCLNNEKSGKILLQLCAALLLLNLAFLVGTVDVSGFSKEACLVVGMLLHYFLLSSLMWMLVEAVEMYQALVTVFSKYERLYLFKRCLLAWGTPVIIVAITAAVNSQCYYAEMNERNFCFLTSKSTVAYYTSLVAPSCTILLVNIFVFIMVARVILKPNFQQQLTKNTTSITPAQIRGAFTVMFLLGITWVFGPLAVNEAQTVFSYLFCICNSLQGFLIFIFRCLLNPEAKMAWTQLIYTGTLKRKRGPIKSVYTDSTSKGGDNRRPSNSNIGSYIRSSTTRTSLSKSGNGFHPHPHQLHTTNGWHPNLNGLRRDKPHEGTASFSSNEHRSFPDTETRLSSESPVTTKRGSLSNDKMETVPDEQTHF